MLLATGWSLMDTPNIRNRTRWPMAAAAPCCAPTPQPVNGIVVTTDTGHTGAKATAYFDYFYLKTMGYRSFPGGTSRTVENFYCLLMSPGKE